MNIEEAMNENNKNELDDDGKSSVDLHVYDLKNRINPSALKQYGISEGLSNDKGDWYFCDASLNLLNKERKRYSYKIILIICVFSHN